MMLEMEAEVKWEDLPDEICFRVFAYLPATDLAGIVSLVCSQWHQFSRDEIIWKYHCLSRWAYWNYAQKQLSKPDVLWLDFFKFGWVRENLSFLVLGAEGGGEHDERLNDVQTKLKQGGLVNVDVFNARASTPTAEFMSKYNAVMFFSYHGFDQKTVGNLLADFVEGGGGVVFCAYSNCGRGNRLDGRWGTRKYDPLTLGNTTRRPNLSLGKINAPKHPILDGVASLDGGFQSSHGDGAPHPSATVLAEWSNGRPLLVELGCEPASSSRKGGIIGLNMYPVSSDACGGGWNPATGGARLMANALHYVARML